MNENVVKITSKQETTTIMSIVFGCLGIVMLVVSYFCSGIFYEMMGDRIERLPIYNQLLSLGLGLPFPFGIVGLLLAALSDKECKYRKQGMIVNIVLLVLTVLIPLAFIGFIFVIWHAVSIAG